MITAWHFVRTTESGPVLRDGRPVVVGEWSDHDGPLVLCESGLHASEDILDALRYAPGAVCCRVECDGEIVRAADKFVCRRRRVLWIVDADRLAREWALDCAERALVRERESGREPDERSWRAVEVGRAYLSGAAGSEELDAARAAAWAAAEAEAAAAAAAAAWAAAEAAWAAADAARAAAAAWAAAEAAWAAAWAASWAAAADRAAERDWQRAALLARIDAARTAGGGT